MNIKPDTDANQDICIGLLLFGVAVLNVLNLVKRQRLLFLVYLVKFISDLFGWGFGKQTYYDVCSNGYYKSRKKFIESAAAPLFADCVLPDE